MTWGPEDEHAIRRGRWKAWIPFLLTLLVLAGAFAYGTGVYDDLPDPVPTHWGANGEPDGWEEKSFGTVFMSLMVGAGTTALMALLALIVPAMTQPAKDPTPYQRYRQEGTDRSIISVLGWVSLLTALLIGYLSVSGWAGPGHLSVFWPVALFLMGTLAVIILPFRHGDRWSTSQAAANGVLPSEEDLAEDRLWLPGGIYNNPADDRIMVPKREGYGIGTTINVGRRKGKIVVAVFLAVFIGGPLVLILGMTLAG